MGEVQFVSFILDKDGGVASGGCGGEAGGETGRQQAGRGWAWAARLRFCRQDLYHGAAAGMQPAFDNLPLQFDGVLQVEAGQFLAQRL